MAGIDRHGSDSNGVARETRDQQPPDRADVQTRAIVPEGRIEDHLERILKLLDIPDLLVQGENRTAKTEVWKQLKDVGTPDRWKDLISNKRVKQAHIQRLWEIAGDHESDIQQNLISSGAWSWRGRSWQFSPGLTEKWVNAVKVFLGLDKDKTEMVGPKTDGTYEVKFRDKHAKYNALSDPRCHLALQIEDVKGSSSKTKGGSSDDQIILLIRTVNAYVLVGQVRKKISEGSKRKEKGSKTSNDKELLAELVLVKVKDAK